MVEALTKDVEVGQTYMGTVTRLMNFGAFVAVCRARKASSISANSRRRASRRSKTSSRSATRSWSKSLRSIRKAHQPLAACGADRRRPGAAAQRRRPRTERRPPPAARLDRLETEPER